MNCFPEKLSSSWFWIVRAVLILSMAKLAALSKDLLPPVCLTYSVLRAKCLANPTVKANN